MTRTIKKWLIAVLLFIMAITVGFGTYSVLSAHAEDDVAEETSEVVASFKESMDVFMAIEDDDVDFASETFTTSDAAYALIFGEDDEWDNEATARAKYQSYWSSYNAARRIYTNEDLGAEVRTALANTDYLRVYANATLIFSDVYDVVVKNNVTMRTIVVDTANLTYADNEEVEALRAEVDALSAGQTQYVKDYTVYTTADGDVSLYYLGKAEEIMAARAEKIQEAIAAIKAIAYKDRDVDGDDYTAADEQEIVLSSAESIQAAAAIITPDDKSYDLSNDGAFFKDSCFAEDGDDTVNYYEVYEVAATALKAMTDEADQILAAIKAIKAEADLGDLYYTLKYDFVATADGNQHSGFDKVYKAYQDFLTNNEGDWENEYFKNSVNADVTKFLEDMNTNLATIDTAIVAVKDLIDAIPAAVYAPVGDSRDNSEYYKAVKAAEDAFNALYTLGEDDDAVDYSDIVDYDKALYTAEADTGYIVENYPDLAAALAQIAKWDEDIDNLVKDVESLVAAKNAEENIVLAYNAIISKRDKFTAEQKADFNSREVGEDYEYADSRIVNVILNNIDSDLLAIEVATNTLNKLIGTVYEDYRANFSASSREQIPDLLEQYTNLSYENKNYITNADKLMEMVAHVDYAKQVLAAWAEKVAVFEDEVEFTVVDGKNVLVIKDSSLTINDWKAIAEAYDLFADLEAVKVVMGQDEDGKDILSVLSVNLQNYLASLDDTEGDEDTTVPELSDEEELDAKYALVYATYAPSAAALQEIIDLAEAMGDIEIDENLAVEDTPAWADGVNAIKGEYVDYADGAQEYLQQVYADEYANYEDALALIPVYEVEGAIAGIWFPSETGDDVIVYDGDIDFLTAVDTANEINGYITLAIGERIDAAIESYLGYKKVTVGSDETVYTAFEAYIKDNAETEIRNIAYLVAAEKYLVGINQTLAAWIAEVEALTNDKYAGYGLDLEAWFNTFDKYAALVGGEWTTSEDDNTVDGDTEGSVLVWVPKYNATTEVLEGLNTDGVYYVLSGDEVDSDKVEYVKTAYAKLLNILEKSNAIILATDGSATIKETSSLNDRIAYVNDTTNQEDTAVDYYEIFASVLRDLENLHTTQEYLLVDMEDFEDVKDSLTAYTTAKDFVELVNKLYAEVFGTTDYSADNEVLDDYVPNELTPAYVDILRVLYDSFDKDTTTLIVKNAPHWVSKLEAVEAAYDEAMTGDDGEVINYGELIKELEEDLANLETELNKAIADGDEALADQIDAIQTQIDTITGKITTLTNSLTTLGDSITAGDKELADKIAALKTQLDGEVETLNNKLTALETDLEEAIDEAVAGLRTELDGKISNLNTQLTNLNTQLTSAIENGDAALAEKITTEINKVNAAIAEAKTALAGDIKEVSDGLTSANTAIAAAEKSIKDVQDKLAELENKVADVEKSNEDLQAKVDKLSSSISGLVAGVVIVGVVLALTIAGGVVLFLRKRK